MNNSQKIGMNILLLGIVSFITDASSEIIIPLMPFFLKFLGGTAIGVGFIVGLVGGLRDSLSSILKGLSGYWSDKIRRKKPLLKYCMMTKIFMLASGHMTPNPGKSSGACPGEIIPMVTGWRSILTATTIIKPPFASRSMPRV